MCGKKTAIPAGKAQREIETLEGGLLGLDTRPLRTVILPADKLHCLVLTRLHTGQNNWPEAQKSKLSLCHFVVFLDIIFSLSSLLWPVSILSCKYKCSDHRSAGC